MSSTIFKKNINNNIIHMTKNQHNNFEFSLGRDTIKNKYE